MRSSSHNPRSDLARQIISKVRQTDRLTVLTVEIFISLSLCTFQKLSVPALSLSSSHYQHSHSPVQVSRSVPCQLGQPWQPQHRKLTRAGLSSSQSGHKYRDSIWTRDQHRAKRRKQDLNRSVRISNVSQESITSSYCLSGTSRTTITKSGTKTVFLHQRVIRRIIFMRR